MLIMVDEESGKSSSHVTSRYSFAYYPHQLSSVMVIEVFSEENKPFLILQFEKMGTQLICPLIYIIYRFV